ncbi:MAG: DUF2339 domain-containing protein [Bacteroidia bacterium]|nr:DUF2339 domain-containing protein [Bacteroidia bacterium]
MSTPQLEEISAKLNELIRQHNQSHQEILELRKQLLLLKKEAEPESVVSADKKISPPPVVISPPTEKTPPPPVTRPAPADRKKIKQGRDLEEYIGGNLISKIGIGILVIGVGFFVKYAIDNDLVSPVIRVIGGFLAGLSLVGLAYILKEKYKNYSSILLGGGLAILYFTTFAAFDFYHLIPKSLAFGLMLVFTAFGVFAAYWYNIQAIAVIGLAGAYAVPILLSDNTGEIRNLFIYISIVNVGILSLAFRKSWRLLNYIAFVLTWGVFLSWMEDRYEAEKFFGLSLTFASVFFLLFYGALLAYKLIHLEKYNWRDVVFLLVNSFIFYGTGYGLIEGIENGDRWLGLFTLANALVHFVVTVLIYNRKLADRNLFFLVAGLVLTFLTLSAPVQLDGNWVTVLWIGEALVVFWVGRTQKVFFYEGLAYILVIMSFFSLVQDWSEGYSASVYLLDDKFLTPLFNIHFLTSFLVLAGLTAINFLHVRYPSDETRWQTLRNFGGVLLPSVLLITLFTAFLPEIQQFFTQRMVTTKIVLDGIDNFNYDLSSFSTLWTINYAFVFMAGLLVVNSRFWKNKALNIVAMAASGLTVLMFLTEGLPALYQLRAVYLNPGENPIFNPEASYLYIRYICYVFLGLNLWMNYRTIPIFADTRVKIALNLALHLIILTVLSAELQHLAHVINRAADTYALERKVQRVGFSVLWGLYGLFLVIIGLWKKLQYLRVASIALFAAILIKVFIFDLDKATLGNKTVIFLALGVLMLIISFLYQRFKNVILGDDPENEKTDEKNE